ncbi:MAG: DUF1887 family protein [Balneolia bacterium]|nr:DUF1887 family protein [Balneolia bacterium]
MKTLVCLLSSEEDIELNYSAATHVNPHSIIICHTADSRDEADQLRLQLENALHPDLKMVQVHAHNLDLIQDVAEQLFMSLQNKSVVLHYSGGTKPMSVGFFEEFRGGSCSLLHSLPNGDTAWWRTSEGFYSEKM